MNRCSDAERADPSPLAERLADLDDLATLRRRLRLLDDLRA